MFNSVKLGELEASLESFQSARDVAESLEDKAAEIAIAKAIDDVHNRITNGILSFFILFIFFVELLDIVWYKTIREIL